MFRRTASLGTICSLVLFCFLFDSSLAVAQGGLHSLEEILRRAVAKAEEPDTSLEHYRIFQHVDINRYDGDGKLEEHLLLLIEVIPVGEHRYHRTLRKNGKPLEGDELTEEQEKEQKFREELNAGEKSNSRSMRITFNETFVAKYHFALSGQEAIHGRPTYVLSFKPKSDDLPEENDADRFLNAASGKIWIDREDFAVAKAQTTLMRPVKIFGGIVASIKNMNLTFVLKKNGDRWLPHRANQRIAGRKLFSSFDTRVKVKFAYRPRAASGTKK